MSEEQKDRLLVCTKGKTVILGTQAIPRREAIKSVLNDIPKVFLKFYSRSLHVYFEQFDNDRNWNQIIHMMSGAEGAHVKSFFQFHVQLSDTGRFGTSRQINQHYLIKFALNPIYLAY